MTTFPFTHQYDRAAKPRVDAGKHGAITIMLLFTIGAVLMAAAVRKVFPPTLAAGMADWDLLQWGAFVTLVTGGAGTLGGGLLGAFLKIMAELRLNRAASEATLPQSQVRDLLAQAYAKGRSDASPDGMTPDGRPKVGT